MTTYYHCDTKGCRNKVRARDYNKDMDDSKTTWTRDSKRRKDYCPECSTNPQPVDASPNFNDIPKAGGEQDGEDGFQDTIECPTCGGDGFYYPFPHTASCPDCNGTGRIPKPSALSEVTHKDDKGVE